MSLDTTADDPFEPSCDSGQTGLQELVAGVGGNARTARTLLLPDGVYQHTLRRGRKRRSPETDRDVVALGLVTLEFAKVLFEK